MISSSPALLEIIGLSAWYGAAQILFDLDLQVRRGEVVALMGRNGAGKSTTFNLVNGQLSADRGSIRLDGVELLGRKPRDIWRLGVGRTFQIAETFASMTALENLQMALLSRDQGLASLFSRAAQYRRDEAMALLAQVGMAEQAERPCAVLAYGDVKRVELAVAIAHAPRLLLMDEPTAGMAPQERLELMALTRRLVLERHMAVLFTEHSMDVVFAYADRIIVLARGRLIASGTPTEVRENVRVQEVYLGGLS